MQKTQTGQHDTTTTNKTGKQIQNSGPTDQLPDVRCTTSSKVSNSKSDNNAVHSRTSQTTKGKKRARCFTKSTNTVNLSTYKLTPAEENLLNKGLNFIPTPSREHPLHTSYKTSLLFDRKRRLKYFFMDKEIENNTSPEDRPFKLTTGLTPPSNPRHKL